MKMGSLKGGHRESPFAALPAALLLLAASVPAEGGGPVTVAATMDASRASVPVTIDGRRVSCVLDTGASAILVSQAAANAAGLQPERAVAEVAPDGRQYDDRTTTIARLVAGATEMRGVPALISSKLEGTSALCGYDFLLRFPTLIDRDASRVTFFPSKAALARLRCMAVNLKARVPVGRLYVNGSAMDRVVLDSGMTGGGALWKGALGALARPLADPEFYRPAAGATDMGMSCGHSGTATFFSGAPAAAVSFCTSPQAPDGYAGIVETSLPTVHQIAIDYPHSRICFGLGTAAPLLPAGSALDRNAWNRLNALHPSAPPRARLP